MDRRTVHAEGLGRVGCPSGEVGWNGIEARELHPFHDDVAKLARQFEGLKTNRQQHPAVAQPTQGFRPARVGCLLVDADLRPPGQEETDQLVDGSGGLVKPGSDRLAVGQEREQSLSLVVDGALLAKAEVAQDGLQLLP